MVVNSHLLSSPTFPVQLISVLSSEDILVFLSISFQTISSEDSIAGVIVGEVAEILRLETNC